MHAPLHEEKESAHTAMNDCVKERATLFEKFQSSNKATVCFVAKFLSIMFTFVYSVCKSCSLYVFNLYFHFIITKN